MILLLALFISLSFGHGSLRVPEPRDIVQNVGVTNGGMDAPIAGAPANDAFVCRGLAPGAPVTTLTAGTPLTITTNVMQVPHVGDCAVYLNLQGDVTPFPREGWFKIANIENCRKANSDVITIPDWVKPSAHAVLRWEWYALHIYPGAEFYSQCVDVTIVNPNAANHGDPDVTVVMPGHLPPASADQYRNPNPPSTNTTITGPAVAKRSGGAAAGGGTGNPAPVRLACTQNSDCPSGVCEVTQFCYDAPGGIGAGGIAAVFFALLFVATLTILVVFIVKKGGFSSAGGASGGGADPRYEELVK